MNFSPTRNQDGFNQESVRGVQKQAVDLGGSNSNYRHWWILWLTLPFLSGCAALKKAAIISGVSTAGAAAGSALSGTVGAAVGALTGATVGQVVVKAVPKPTAITSQPITAETVVAQAPTNLWDVVSHLGLWAGLIILIPLVLGILLPGPVQFKKK